LQQCAERMRRSDALPRGPPVPAFCKLRERMAESARDARATRMIRPGIRLFAVSTIFHLERYPTRLAAGIAAPARGDGIEEWLRRYRLSLPGSRAPRSRKRMSPYIQARRIPWKARLR
jgi:hypothetical protein